ncbi:MAG: DUF4163 domain-containing protein [Ruminococcaceae bacterium]|nr:DUF4163 domain-containing protein [Oscillospiraceae bacterium]
MSISITEKKIKSKVRLGERVAVVENIKYPYFESEKHKKLCKKMNDFYSSIAEKYSYHARNKLPRKLKFKLLTCRLPIALSMSYTVSLCQDDIVSIVLDLTFSEGKSIKTRRFSQMWSVKNNCILPLSDIIKLDRASKRKIFSLVCTSAAENAENPAFGYYSDYLVNLSKHFDVHNCFAVPKGLCFYVNAGILSPIKYGTSNFVLGYDKLCDVLSGDYPADNGEEDK